MSSTKETCLTSKSLVDLKFKVTYGYKNVCIKYAVFLRSK